MEKKKEKRRISWAFTLFACLITAIVVYLGIRIGDNGVKVLNPIIGSSKNSSLNMVGYFEESYGKTDADVDFSGVNTIVLYDNGLFYAKYINIDGTFPGCSAPTVGSYAIKDNKIVIYSMFEGTCGTGTSLVFESKEYDIVSADQFKNADHTYSRITENKYIGYYDGEQINVNTLVKDFIDNSVIETKNYMNEKNG